MQAGAEGALLMQGGARKGSLTYINPLNTDEVNVSTDTDVDGKTGRITADEYSCVRHDLNYGWKYFDLTRMITLYDARGGIEAGIGEYWDVIGKKLGLASIKGALAAANASGLTVGDADEVFGRDLIIDATATADEFADNFDILITSSKNVAKLKKDRANFAPGETGIALPTYAGMRVVVSNMFGEDTSVIARSGALAFHVGTVPFEVPVEVQRDAAKGTGGGREILWSRRSFVVHPQGFNYVGAVALAPDAMATGSNWTMEIAPKFVGFRAIKHAA
ncbi:hypothetical protein NHF48_019710 [Sphingomonas sp. H160509]|uniref:hypothetical protein n=1 Tax=Sphingomonas sp. H160509 TaxID=2955313 RepID=UPI0021E77F53|nr:hypothetical protein [Sphingomonas sp. H160509]MDD1452645.1 hypothetical protein [Sphingomonas sp. H160509]